MRSRVRIGTKGQLGDGSSVLRSLQNGIIGVVVATCAKLTDYASRSPHVRLAIPVSRSP